MSMLISLAVYFDKISLRNLKREIEECEHVLSKINKNELDEIADKINNSDIIVFGPNDFENVIRRFKNDFNENSKLIVANNTFPEMNHNDINGLENPELNKNRSVLLIRDKDESFEMENRIEITKYLIKKNVKSIYEIWTPGESRLAKIVSLIYMSGYISCKLAELNGLDAGNVDIIERLKKELKERINLVERLEEKLKLKYKEFN